MLSSACLAQIVRSSTKAASAPAGRGAAPLRSNGGPPFRSGHTWRCLCQHATARLSVIFQEVMMSSRMRQVPSPTVTVMVAAAEVWHMARAFGVACLQAPRQCVRVPEAPGGALGPPAQHPTEGSQLPEGQHSHCKWVCRYCTVYALLQTLDSGMMQARRAPLHGNPGSGYC